MAYLPRNANQIGPSLQILFRVALTLITLFREEIVAAEDILELNNVFKKMMTSDIVHDCHAFMGLVFKTTSKSVRRAEIERLRRQVGQSALD